VALCEQNKMRSATGIDAGCGDERIDVKWKAVASKS
jgi:hypothetical protein